MAKRSDALRAKKTPIAAALSAHLQRVDHEAMLMQEAEAADYFERMKMPLNDEQTNALGVVHLMSFDQMVNGRGTEADWATVCGALNTAVVLSERGFGPEYEGRIVEALDGAARCKVRHQEKGVWGFDGPAMQAIKVALDVYGQQLEYATREEVMDALATVSSRAKSGHAYKEVKVA